MIFMVQKNQSKKIKNYDHEKTTPRTFRRQDWCGVYEGIKSPLKKLAHLRRESREILEKPESIIELKKFLELIHLFHWISSLPTP